MLNRLDGFRTSWDGNSYSDKCAAGVLGFLSWQNLSDPAWTYDNLVFPSFNVTENATSIAKEGKRASAVIPARRATLKCNIAHPPKTTIIDGDLWIDPGALGSCTWNGTSIPYVISSINDLSSQAFIGAINQLNHSEHMAKGGCPSLSFYLGSFGPPQTYLSDDITAFACTQHVQEVSTRVSLFLPGLELDLSNPPVPDESTARYVPNDRGNNSNAFDYPVAFPIASAFIPATKGSTFSIPGLDHFYTAIMYDKDGIPGQELVGQENAPRLINATIKLYSRYMAQVMSLKMRESLNSSTHASPQIQAVLYSEKLRLVQNSGPKIALQVILAIMFICGALSWMTMRLSDLLPHDPCSIAGIATLLSGSRLWEEKNRYGALDKEDSREILSAQTTCSGHTTHVTATHTAVEQVRQRDLPYLGAREESQCQTYPRRNVGYRDSHTADTVEEQPDGPESSSDDAIAEFCSTHAEETEDDAHVTDKINPGHALEDICIYEARQNQLTRKLSYVLEKLN